MRDLTRARDDIKAQQKKARQQLNAFVIRHGFRWPTNKSNWSQAHYNWLESLRFERDWQQVVLQEYIDAVKAADQRVADLTAQMERVLPQWSLAPVVESLVALRGIDKLAAMVLLAELGDISRFDSPKQLMAFLGLVPSEHSSGSKRRQGGITKTGNGHARRMLVESAWSYRFPPRQTAHLKRKGPAPPPRPRRSPGGPRNASVAATRRCCNRAKTPSRPPWRSPASWWALSGTSPAARCPACSRRPLAKASPGKGGNRRVGQGTVGRCGEPLSGLYRHRTPG
jgi:transposase